MKKKLPMKGDPPPAWLAQRKHCPCGNLATRDINGQPFCGMCVQAGTEMLELTTWNRT